MAGMTNKEIEAPSVLAMREQLRLWLSGADGEIEQLVNWLQGNGLPAGNLEERDVEEGPYTWLLHGLPLADERYRAETELAARAARLLEMQPDVRWHVERPDKGLYNLLMLCAGLSCPTQLADPLYAMFQRRRLEGSWDGINLRQALESALIANQRDNRLETVWREMLKQGRHDFLTGDEYAGFEGIRLMPASSEARGEPALDALGAALALMATHQEKRRDRRVEFHQLIDRVVRTYPGRPTWYSDLVYLAHIHHWPDWAFSCLPKMCIPLASSSNRQVALIWEGLLDTLKPDTDFHVEEWLCPNSQVNPGLIAKVSLSEVAVCFLNDIVPETEKRRLRTFEFHDYKTVKGTVIEALSFIEQQVVAETYHRAMADGRSILYRPDKIRAARERVRNKLGVMTADAPR